MTTLKRTARMLTNKTAAGILTLSLAVVGIGLDGNVSRITDIGKQAGVVEVVPAGQNELVKGASVPILDKDNGLIKVMEILGVDEL